MELVLKCEMNRSLSYLVFGSVDKSGVLHHQELASFLEWSGMDIKFPDHMGFHKAPLTNPDSGLVDWFGACRCGRSERETPISCGIQGI